MPDTRCSFVVTDRRGAVREFTVGVRQVAALIAAVLAAPLLSATFVWLSMQSAISRIALENARIEIENSAFRATADRLSEQALTLQSAVAVLADRIEMNPLLRAAVDRLADDGAHAPARLADGAVLDAAGHAFDRLSEVLGALDDTLGIVKRGVAYREALADATPIIWPADGWLSTGYGYRPDPFTGRPDFHPAVDISADEGRPVHATATGRVAAASRNGAYGNLVEIEHGFGLTTRYGHLSAFAVSIGDTVLRGDVIGSVGATGRATGHHVHYEVRVHGRTIDPARLLVDPRFAAAD